MKGWSSMISWRVERNGQALSDRGHFDNFLQQGYLLPMLDVGADYIDEYGAWSYIGDDLRRLRLVIANWSPRYEPFAGQRLMVTTLTEGTGYIEADSIIHLFEVLDAMAEKAIRENAEIKFYGD